MTTVEAPAGTAGGTDPHRPGRAVPALGESLRSGAATGVGSLPHRSVHDAAAFALREYDVPAIPTLPRRSPAEGMIAQAVVGINGVTLGQYGSIAVDVDALDPGRRPSSPTSPTTPSPASGRSSPRPSARGLRGPVKWQFVGPVTLGVALTRVGVPVRRRLPRRRPRRALAPRRARRRRGRRRCRRRRSSSGSTSRGSAS